ncbi:DUF169 domain-containing protein [Irregularibacter muris]|uniref:DUF169 domain-containing protein n=1 Tax=Irregularibacter muris TaxID=1796619 RepID=A0AAE3KZT3_9FIRM|nr:DUF169 domain-containing protein [Irregularibacter muris]MCR1899700.1 DUF169 domain-containing protein [Irregularibacter muris]
MIIKESAKWLNILLQLERKPVGIKFLLTREDYDAFPASENKNRMSYCTVVKRAGDGISQKIHRGHSACMGGAMALGLEETIQEAISGRRRFYQGAYRDLGVCRNISKNMVFCEHKAYGVAVMPLEAFDTEPDVVIIVCNPFNGMRIVQGYSYKNGHATNIKLSGMSAICQECTSLPYEENQLNLSLLCSGTRMLARWKKDEMAIGMPFRLYLEVVEGLKNTVNPLERNAEKEQIAEKLLQEEFTNQLEIKYNHNYDDNAYKGGRVEKRD